MINPPDLRYLFTEDIYLIDSKEEKKPAPSKQDPDSQNVLVLVNHSISEEDKNNLTKVLQAVNLGDDQVNIVDGSKFTNLKELASTTEYHSKVILLFGVGFWNKDLYQIQKQDQKTILPADDLKTIFSDRDRKMKLWNALKKIFLQK